MEEKKNQLPSAQVTQKNSAELFEESFNIPISAGNSIAELMNKARPLSSIVPVYGKEEAIKFIKMCIIYLCEFYGVTWNDLQIQHASRELYSNYHHWSHLDWKHFISRVMSAYYEEKMYGAFNPSMMMAYAVMHNDEWMSAGESMTIQKHIQIKSEMNVLGDVVRDKLNEKRKELNTVDPSFRPLKEEELKEILKIVPPNE